MRERCPVGSRASDERKCPNLLLITPDQMRADAMGCMGNPVVKTPHLDRLAAGGVLFRNAVCQNPMCVPSRFSIITNPIHEDDYIDSYVGRRAVDDNGDGTSDRWITVPDQIFHFLTLLGTMGEDYWCLPEKEVGRHRVSGFATKTSRDLRVLLYSHCPTDMESASDKVFNVSLDLAGLNWTKVRVQEWRFDKDANSYFKEAVGLSKKGPGKVRLKWGDRWRIRKLVKSLKSGNPATQRKALERLTRMGARAADAFPAVFKIAQSASDKQVGEAATNFVKTVRGKGVTYTPEEIRPVEEQAQLRVTRTFSQDVSGEGRLTLTVSVSANGANFLVIEPDAQALTHPLRILGWAISDGEQSGVAAAGRT